MEVFTKKNPFIRKKGIYKDTVFSKSPKQEFQLRPNACIAIAVAPELFIKKNVHFYLAAVEKYLIEPKSLGVRTLEQQHEDYMHYFDINEDSSNYKSALGFSIHNGPESVPIYGYFLRALISKNVSAPHFFNERIMSYLSNHKRHIKSDEW